MALTSGISSVSANGFSVLAFLRPRNGNRTIVAGGVGSFQHRIDGLLQQVIEASQQNRGTSNTALSNVTFSSVMAQGNDAGGAFCLNGTPDGSISAQAFAPYEPITHVGSRSGGVESYSGDIVEIRVYNRQLSMASIQAIEAEFVASYQAITNAVSLPNIANPTFDIDADAFVTFPGYVNSGSNPAGIVNWNWTPSGGAHGVNPGKSAGTPFRNNGNNAGQVAFIQRAGSISQVTSGWDIGRNYRLTFDYNARTSPAASLSVSIDAASYSDPSVPAVGGSFGYYAANLLVTPTTTTPTLTVGNLNGANDNTLLLDNFRVFRNGPNISDNGFELPVQPANNWKQANGTGGGDLTGSAWTITGAGGITRNRGAFHPSMYAAEGEQFALLQATSALAQVVNGFNPGAQYSLSLLAMRRTAGGTGGNNLEVVLDAGLGTELVLIDITEVTATGFQEEAATFTATKSSYTLTIRANNPLGGDRTTFVDNVWFNQLTVPTRTVFRFR